MAKGWKFVGTNDMSFDDNRTKSEKRRQEHKFNNAIKNVRKMKIEDLQEESEKVYLRKMNEKNNLLNAYNDKKLKSKELIKKAKALKKNAETAT